MTNTPVAENKKFLSDLEREIVLFIEKYHSVTGTVPDDSSILDYAHSIRHELNVAQLQNIKAEPLFLKSMEVRGIEIYRESQTDPLLSRLTPRQMSAVAVMMNYIDRRSDEKKLRDIGVSTEEWSNWMLDSAFSSYIQSRAENILGTTLHEAHLGLMKGVRQGNIAAVKLFYEITGRYNPDQDNAVNIRMLLHTVIELIQKHVKDPQVLSALASELTQVAIETQSGAKSSPVARPAMKILES